MIQNIIAIEIFKGNPDADKIIKYYLDKGYQIVDVEEKKHYKLYWFAKVTVNQD